MPLYYNCSRIMFFSPTFSLLSLVHATCTPKPLPTFQIDFFRSAAISCCLHHSRSRNVIFVAPIPYPTLSHHSHNVFSISHPLYTALRIAIPCQPPFPPIRNPFHVFFAVALNCHIQTPATSRRCYS